jgi:Putative zinc-finger
MNRMNEHPDDLLAEYVDGSLGSEERAAVDAHLTGCERCREEAALATEARAALGMLPDVLATGGTALAVRREAGRAPRGGSRAWRAAGVAAVAAALVVGGVVVVNELNQDQPTEGRAAGAPGEPRRVAEDQGGAEEAPAAASEEGFAELDLPSVPTYIETARRYDTSSLPRLGQRLRDQVGASLDGGLAATATAYYQGFDLSLFTPQVRTAIRCVLQEIPPEQLVVPFRIEAASFEGDPAYVAAFLQGPAPDQPYDRVLIWVVDRDDCSFRSLASQRL